MILICECGAEIKGDDCALAAWAKVHAGLGHASVSAILSDDDFMRLSVAERLRQDFEPVHGSERVH